eukprot:3608985-Rhodomonas_salina.1
MLCTIRYVSTEHRVARQQHTLSSVPGTHHHTPGQYQAPPRRGLIQMGFELCCESVAFCTGNAASGTI